MVIAIVCDFAAHLMRKLLSTTETHTTGTFATAEITNGLCSTRAGSHDAKADNIPKTDPGLDNQPNASAMGAWGAATRWPEEVDKPKAYATQKEGA
ncbi:hypothetical protein N9L68_04255 [bacterium]|nr:hypothetical protein [bacterium]